MSFLHTGLLWVFLPLVVIPILLHLLTLHRLRTVELSTFRFLFDSYVQQRRRMKFLEALIAALRTAFLLFLVFTISRPVVKHWDALFGGGGSGREIVLLIDTSASMGAKSQGRTALQRAKEAALKVVGRLGDEDRVTIVRVGAKAEEVCSRFSSDAKSIETEIERLQVSPARANLFSACSLLFGAESREISQPLVYLFSDLQLTGWREFEEGDAESLVPEGTEIIAVDVGAGRPPANVAVIGEAPAGRRAIVGLPITLKPVLKNYSTSESREVAVSVLVDAKEIARKQVSLKPGEQTSAEITFTPREAGVIRGRYEIPSDAFEDDNEYLFTVAVAPRVRVLLINGNPAAEPQQNDGLYLRTAMVSTEARRDPPPVDPTDVSQPPEAAAAARLEAQRQFMRSLEVIELTEAKLNGDALRGADVVMLANCGALQPAQFHQLCDYVADGGGLIILPGDKVNVEAYNKQFFPAPKRPEETLMPAQLAASVGDPEKPDEFVSFAALDLAHPVLSVFADSEQRYLTKVNVYRRFGLTSSQGSAAARLATFTDGQAAILENRLGTGRVLLTAIPFNTRWSNLPMKPEFVPLVLRMIGHTKRAADLQGPGVVAPGGVAEFTLAQHWSPASATVTDEADRTTAVEFQRSNSQLKGAFKKTVAKGFYEVAISGGRAEQPERGALSFAVNVDAAESDFTAITKSQLETLAPGAKLTFVDATAEAQQTFGSIGDAREIWRPLIFLLFLIIGVEFMLSTLGGQRADGEPTTGHRIRRLASGSWVDNLAESEERETIGSA